MSNHEHHLHPHPHNRPTGGLHLLVGDMGAGTTTAAMAWAVSAATAGYQVTVASTQETSGHTWRRLACAYARRHPGDTHPPVDEFHARLDDRLTVIDHDRLHNADGRPFEAAVRATRPGGWLVYDQLDEEQPQDVKNAALRRAVNILGTWHAPVGDRGEAETIMYPVLHTLDTLTLVLAENAPGTDRPLNARGLLDGPPPPSLCLHAVKDRHRPLTTDERLPLYQDGNPYL